MRTKALNLILIGLLFNCQLKAETFSIGSYIINMGVTPQTVANGMKPYGLVYEFLKTYKVPVRWVIGVGKIKDSADFSYNGTRYKGGTFIIPKEYITSAVKTRITYWKGQGVVMDTTTTTLTVNVTRVLTSAPIWTISTVNTSIATGMFTYAGIPSSAYNTTAPASLGSCDDIFAMPHADPTWALHGNLYTWNRSFMGAIWANCHAISVLENLVNPSNSAQQMNFLSTQGLINYGSHADGTPAYKYFFNRGSYNGAAISARADDPVFQMIGIEDAAHTNGSEQIYIPIAGSGSGWRNTTKIGCYDSTQSNVSAFPNGPAAATLYGRGFGLNSAGYVMYQSGHNITGTGTANISAMRQFFNFSFMAMEDKVPSVSAYNINSILNSGTTYSFSVNATSPIGASLSYQWSSSFNGTFSNPTSSSTTFTTNQAYSDTSATITCLITDACGRITFVSKPIQVLVALPVKLVNFDAEKTNNSIKLTWTSANEEELLSYQVERSIDGENYNQLSNIEPHNKINSLNEYQFNDYGVIQNHNTLYYRLKVLYSDGTYSVSNVIEVNPSQSVNGIISVVPVPSSDVVNIELSSSFSLYTAMEIIDIYGRTVLSTSKPEMIGSRTIKLDINQYANGIYFINLRKKSGGYSIARFVKS